MHLRFGSAYVLAIGFAVLVTGSGPLLAQERERSSDILARLVSAYEEINYDSTRSLALRLLSDEAATPDEKAQAAFYMAATYLDAAPPRRADARRAMQAAINASVFARPDTSTFSAEVLLEYARTRSGAFVIGLRGLPTDTVLGLEGAMVESEVGGTRPATISVSLESADRRLYQLASNVRVGVGGRVPLQFAANGAFFPTGSYVMRFEAVDDSAGARATPVTVPVSIVADTVAVVPLPDTLADSVFRPERRPWGPASRTLLGGLFVGALTAGASQLMTPPTLKDAVGMDGRALGVGAFIAVSGLIGMIASRPGAVVPENVDYNESRHQQWTEERERIIATNESRRAEARIRLQFGRPSR